MDGGAVGDSGTSEGGVMVRDSGPTDAMVGCTEGNRLVCTCTDGGVGARICSGGQFGECEDCMAVTELNEPKCVPGYYEGTATGTYRSSAGFLGIFAPFAEDNASKLAFNLLEMSAQELFYEVRDACVHVLRQDSDVDDGSARFWLSGRVDCSTGVLEGEMRGYYTAEDALTGAKTRTYYRGKIAGLFDSETESFVDTAYKIVEPPTVLGDEPGGEGVWTAEHKEEGETTAESTLEECLGDEYPGDDVFNDVDL